MSKSVLKDSERTPCEVWSRVMGYLRPRSEYNIGKKSEHEARELFVEPKKIPHKGEKDLTKEMEDI